MRRVNSAPDENYGQRIKSRFFPFGAPESFLMRWKCLSNQQPYPPSRRRAAKRWLQGCSAAANPSCRGASGASLPPRDAPSDAPDCLFVRRHRAYAPVVLPCMRADAVLMLLPAINSSSRDSARSDSTASPGASLDANSNLQASLRSVGVRGFLCMEIKMNKD